MVVRLKLDFTWEMVTIASSVYLGSEPQPVHGSCLARESSNMSGRVFFPRSSGTRLQFGWDRGMGIKVLDIQLIQKFEAIQ